MSVADGASMTMARMFVLAIWLSASLAHAQTAASATGGVSELEVEARARFQLGQLYYSQARFADAAHEFEAAYATHPHPLLLHNIYLARRDLGDIPGAVDALTRYLATATDLSASDRRLLEGRLATMQRQLPATTAPTETPVVVETHETSETASSTEPEETPTETATEASTAPAPVDEEEGPPPATSGGIGIVPGAVVVAVGGAALIGAAIAGGVALGIQSDRDNQCTLPGGSCPASLDQNDYASRFGAARDAGWGLLIVGAATAAIGAVLLGVGASEHTDTPTPSAACDGNGCIATLSGRF